MSARGHWEATCGECGFAQTFTERPTEWLCLQCTQRRVAKLEAKLSRVADMLSEHAPSDSLVMARGGIMSFTEVLCRDLAKALSDD